MRVTGDNDGMELTDETFRELARSSPWRWRSVHLLRESGGPPPDGEVEAWIRRPDRMRVAYDGGVHIVRHATDEVDAERGTDPMWQSYQWVAMLAPVELADGQDAPGTVLANLRETQRRGRRTWWANAVPTEAYFPRCGCCPLLWSEISDRGEYGGENPYLSTPDHPTSYEVALDVETGICVALHAQGGTPLSPDLEVTVLAVDELYPDDFFRG